MARPTYIKIETNIFHNPKIKYIRRQPNGNNLALVWVMLLTIAGRGDNDGALFLTDGIPYTVDMLAAELGFDEAFLKAAVEEFVKLNMLDGYEGVYYVVGWNEHQEADEWEEEQGDVSEEHASDTFDDAKKKLERIREQNRARKQRQRSKTYAESDNATEENNVCHVTVTQMSRDMSRDTERERENEKERSKEKEKEKEKDFKTCGARDAHAPAPAARTHTHEEEPTLKADEAFTESDGETMPVKTKTGRKETSLALFERLRPEYALPDKVVEKLREWLDYKMQRKEPYVEQGMRSQLRRIETGAAKYGADALCRVIDDSMASGWKGIIFDRLAHVTLSTPTRSPTGVFQSFTQREYGNDEFSEIERRMMKRGT